MIYIASRHKFYETYTKHYNTAYPPKSQHKRRNNERKNPKPWILPWLEDACARKNKLYHSFVKEPTTANKVKYKKMNDFCKKHIDKAKAKYHKKYFDEHKDNSKKQWQMINSILGRKNRTKCVNKLIDKNGNLVNTPTAIADNFNDYFANIASNLKKNNGDSESCDHSIFLENSVSNSIYLRAVTGSEVYETIKNFKNKATQDIKMSSIKVANNSHGFTQILAKIINKSFRDGVFPDQLKNAKVVPIHKGGSKTDVENYRPISILASFSKVYEKLMHQRILLFLESNDSLVDTQYGFRPGRSCEHALLKAQDIILDSLNRRQISLLLLIDFSKAFDMVEHSILLKKLEHYGIRGPALNWMSTYLHNRSQFVSIDGKKSSTKVLSHGVPQGSILGPLLFIIYINDIPNILKSAKFILYADDVNIILTAATINEINQQLSTLTEILPKWVFANGLALNLKKTHYMIFSRSRSELPGPLILCNKDIERKSESKFLGVILDEKLTWASHIIAVKSKMSRYIGVMCKVKKFLPLSARIQIFHSFVQSYLNFCSLVWGFAAKSHINSLFSKQKQGLRAIVPGFIKYKFKDGVLPGHTKEHFNEYAILTVPNLIASNALIFTHKVRFFKKALPESICETIAANSPVPGSTYESCQSWTEKYENNIYNNSIFYKGPLLSASPKVSNFSTPGCLFNIKSYKTNVKKGILGIQSDGNDEWSEPNFLLYGITGLRSSDRINVRDCTLYTLECPPLS